MHIKLIYMQHLEQLHYNISKLQNQCSCSTKR